MLFSIPVEILAQVKDIGIFLTDQMIELAEKEVIDFPQYERAFYTTFNILVRTTGGNSFRRYVPNSDRYTGGFLLSAYEVIALGVGFNHLGLPNDDDLTNRIKNVFESEIYAAWSGSGITAMRRLPHIIPLGREIFKS